MKGTGAKRNVCPGSCMSTGAKFPVAPVESAPMLLGLWSNNRVASVQALPGFSSYLNNTVKINRF